MKREETVGIKRHKQVEGISKELTDIYEKKRISRQESIQSETKKKLLKEKYKLNKKKKRVKMLK